MEKFYIDSKRRRAVADLQAEALNIHVKQVYCTFISLSQRLKLTFMQFVPSRTKQAITSAAKWRSCGLKQVFFHWMCYGVQVSNGRRRHNDSR